MYALSAVLLGKHKGEGTKVPPDPLLLKIKIKIK